MRRRWRQWWQWWHRAEDTTDEARAQLQMLEQRDPEVKRLGAELRKQQRANNFSGMVNRAIARGAREGP